MSAAYRRPGAVRWADAPPGGADGVGTELDLLEAVDSDVEVEVNGAAIGDEDAIADIVEALLLERLELGEESLWKGI